MTVYIEILLLDNICADIAICYATLVTLKQKVGKLRLLFLILVSSLQCILFILLPQSITVVYKLIALISMLALLKSYKTIKDFLLTLVIFVAYSFTLAGACYFIFDLKLNANGLVSYEMGGGIGLFALAIIVFLYFVRQLTLVKVRKTQLMGERKVTISVKQKQIRLKGYIDSGNLLLDDNNKPIFVLSNKCKRYFLDMPYSYTIVNTAVCKDLLKTYTADYVEILIDSEVKRLDNVSLALANTCFDKYEILLQEGI